jgi:hypothetical protein
MVQTVKKNGNASGKNLQSLTYIAYDTDLSKWASGNKDKEMSDANMNDLFAVRVRMTNDFDKGALNKSEYGELMKKTGIPFLKKIESYDSGDTWVTSEKPYYTGFSAIRGQLDKMDASPDQKLYAYESFLREYTAAGGTDERSDVNRAQAREIANNAVQQMMNKKFPNWDPKTSSAIVTGQSVYLSPNLQKNFKVPMNAKITEWDDGK